MVIGISGHEEHYSLAMRRLRVLSALLGCLAVIAAALPTAALAWAPSQASQEAETGYAVGGALCSQHCPSCEGSPCPPQATRCTVACVGVTPTLGVAVFALWTPPGGDKDRPQSVVPLYGLAPPPDLSPPRL